MGASAWEIDEKFGLLFLETIKLDYKFEVRDKQKFLWAKLKYNF
jgi:hypothetical protein